MFRHSTASPSDLWAVFENYYFDNGFKLQEHVSFTDFALTWTDQSGYPVVNVVRNNSTLHVNQVNRARSCALFGRSHEPTDVSDEIFHMADCRRRRRPVVCRPHVHRQLGEKLPGPDHGQMVETENDRGAREQCKRVGEMVDFQLAIDRYCLIFRARITFRKHCCASFIASLSLFLSAKRVNTI